MCEIEELAERVLDVNRHWLPPEPHLRRVVEMVSAGRAHVERRGHDEPPLIVFEDGGVIELPKIRYQETYRGIEIVAGETASGDGATKHPDVCGCVDEFEGLIHDAQVSPTLHREHLNGLIDDALYMIARMRKRLSAYEDFMAQVAVICARQIDIPETEQSSEAAQAIRAFLADRFDDVPSNSDQLDALAEAVRDVASKQEAALYAYRDACIQIGALYEQIRGSRNWQPKPE